MIVTQINSVLAKILPGSNPFIFLIVAVVGGFFLKRWLLLNTHLDKILWAVAAAAIYYAILMISKFVPI